MSDELGGMWKKTVVAYFEVLSEEYHEKPMSLY
jgi:hypothetical protein